MLNKDIKQEILKITEGEKLAKFLNENNVDIDTDDEELIKHFTKYLNFGVSEENGIIYDLRNKSTY